MSETKPVDEQNAENAETEELSAENLSSASGGGFFSGLKHDVQKVVGVVKTVSQVANTVSKVAKFVPK